MANVDLVQPTLQFQCLVRVPSNVRGLSVKRCRRLMYQNARIRKTSAPAFLASTKKQRRRGGRLTDAERLNCGANVLHGVVNCEPRRHDSARRVDINSDFFFGILGLEKKQLRGDQTRSVILDRSGNEDNSFLEKSRIN